MNNKLRKHQLIYRRIETNETFYYDEVTVTYIQNKKAFLSDGCVVPANWGMSTIFMGMCSRYELITYSTVKFKKS
jgi:hypothetical protein